MANSVEVLLDKAANNLSLIAIDDTTGDSVEHTLSLEDAWSLVTDLNAAIQKLTKLPEPKVVHNTYPKRKPNNNPPRVREAVLNSIGADQVRPRYVPPGSPSMLPTKGLRNLYEQPTIQRDN